MDSKTDLWCARPYKTFWRTPGVYATSSMCLVMHHQQAMSFGVRRFVTDEAVLLTEAHGYLAARGVSVDDQSSDFLNA